MKKVKQILLIFLACSTSAYAQWTKLECGNKKDTTPITIFINESANSVYKYTLVGESIYDVSFNPFVVKFSSKEEIMAKGNYARYIYRLNRQHGNLNVSLEDGDKFLWQFQCVKVKMDNLLF